MIHVEVDFKVREAHQSRALALLDHEIPKLHALPGNILCRILVDPKDESAITLQHQWADLASLDAHRCGPVMAKLGTALRPMMTGAPSTRVYEAELIS